MVGERTENLVGLVREGRAVKPIGASSVRWIWRRWSPRRWGRRRLWNYDDMRYATKLSRILLCMFWAESYSIAFIYTHTLTASNTCSPSSSSPGLAQQQQHRWPMVQAIMTAYQPSRAIIGVEALSNIYMAIHYLQTNKLKMILSQKPLNITECCLKSLK